jgi:hypothetical protein
MRICFCITWTKILLRNQTLSRAFLILALRIVATNNFEPWARHCARINALTGIHGSAVVALDLPLYPAVRLWNFFTNALVYFVRPKSFTTGFALAIGRVARQPYHSRSERTGLPIFARRGVEG